MHIIHIMANNSAVPYFNWFADQVQKHSTLKFTFIALYPERPKMLDDMANRGSDCIWVKYDCNNRKKDMLKACWVLYKVFKKLKPDVVHTHLFDDSLPGLVAARLAGIKKRVITKQDTTFHWYYAPQWVKADKFNNWNATHLIAPTSECHDFLISCEKANADKITVIHHGIPPQSSAQSDSVKEALVEKYALKNKIVIGTVSRLIEWKGYKDIINVAEKIVLKYPKVHFLFVGRGEQKNELETLITEKKLNNHITFTDWIAPQDIPSLYGILDIYLHAAKFEPFGFVIAEAMLNGIPVVSTATGAAKDAILHKENGYVVAYENIQELENGIEFMILNDRENIGQKGKETALKMYQLKTMFENYKQLYL